MPAHLPAAPSEGSESASPSPVWSRDAVALAVGFALLYAAGATRTVQGADVAQFMTVAGAGGVAHPPGYPLYTALSSFLVAAVPFGPVAWKASLASAVLAGATVAAIHQAVAGTVGRGGRAAAIVAAVSTGVSPFFWKWSGAAEVLTGAALTVALILWVAVRSARGARGIRQAALLGAAFATGIANHHTAILMFPLLAFAGLSALPRPLTWRSSGATLGAFVGTALLLGLAPYLLLTLDGGAWRWGDTTSPGGLVHHFLRADYGTFTASSRVEGDGWWGHPLLLVTGMWTRFPGVLWALAPLGLGLLVTGRTAVCGLSSRTTARLLGVSVLASWLLSGPLFLSKFNLPIHGYSRVVVERFHAVPDVLVAFVLGIGAAAVIGSSRWSRRAIPVGILAANLVVGAALAAPRATWVSRTVLTDYLEDSLESVEPNAVVLAHGDSMFFGGRFVQKILGVNADVLWLNAGLLPYPWYRAAVAAEHPDLTLVGSSGTALSPGAFVATNLGRRPLYAAPRALLKDDGFADRIAGIAVPIPHGSVLMKMVPPAQAPPPGALEPGMREAVAGLRLRSTIEPEDLDHQLDAAIWENYALTWTALASGYDAMGDPVGKARCDETARWFAPWLLEPSSL